MTEETNYREEESIDLRKYVTLLMSYKKFLISTFIFFGVIAVVYAKSLPNVYTSQILLSPKDSQSFSMPTGVSGLAAVAGITLPQSKEQNLVDLSLEVLSSMDFFEIFYNDQDFLKDLVAVKKYDSGNRTIAYDDKKYDPKTNSLKSFEENGIVFPSFQLSYEKFVLKHLSFKKDLKTGFVSISVRHESPVVAKEWLDRIHFQLNNYVKSMKKEEANEFKNYLSKELSKNNLPEIDVVLSGLIKQQIQTLMLAEASNDYVFYIIDTPRVPELKTGPNRAIICIVFSAISMFIVISLIIILDIYNYKITPSFNPTKFFTKK